MHSRRVHTERAHTNTNTKSDSDVKFILKNIKLQFNQRCKYLKYYRYFSPVIILYSQYRISFEQNDGEKQLFLNLLSELISLFMTQIPQTFW